MVSKAERDEWRSLDRRALVTHFRRIADALEAGEKVEIGAAG